MISGTDAGRSAQVPATSPRPPVTRSSGPVPPESGKSGRNERSFQTSPGRRSYRPASELTLVKVLEDKEFVGPEMAALFYFVMLAIHIVLSAVSVPLVLYNVVVGLTHSTEEVGQTAHPRVGRITVAVWSVSLTLGVLAYVLLNHVYTYEFVRVTGF